jgi:hypothetical protein
MCEGVHAEHAPECLERPILTARGESFTLHQVLGAAHYLGLADGLWGQLYDSLVCETYATEEGFEDDPEQLQMALDEFRYSRGLVSAEETERWLAERQLSEEQLVDALARDHWRRRFEGQLGSIRPAYAPRPGLLAEALWPEMLVHGQLRSLALALARRVVAPELLPGGGASMEMGRETQSIRAPGPAPRGCPSWAECSPEWCARLADMEALYRRVVSSLVSPRRLAEALVARRLDLTRFRLFQARCSSPDVAREALWCIVQDGESFEQATGRAAASREDRILFLEQAAKLLAPLLVSALPGECFLVEEEEEQGEEEETEEGESGTLLVYVAEKSPPRLEDPEVRSRLESALLERSFAAVIDEHVRWLCPME